MIQTIARTIATTQSRWRATEVTVRTTRATIQTTIRTIMSSLTLMNCLHVSSESAALRERRVTNQTQKRLFLFVHGAHMLAKSVTSSKRIITLFAFESTLAEMNCSDVVVARAT